MPQSPRYDPEVGRLLLLASFFFTAPWLFRFVRWLDRVERS